MTLPKNGNVKKQKNSYEEVKCPYCHKKFKLDETNTEQITKTEKVIYCNFCQEEFNQGMCK